MTKIKNKKVQPEKWYNLKEIVELGLFSWCKDIKTVRNWILADKKKKDVLKAVITGKGRHARYLMLGRNINSFVASVEDGTYTK